MQLGMESKDVGTQAKGKLIELLKKLQSFVKQARPSKKIEAEMPGRFEDIQARMLVLIEKTLVLAEKPETTTGELSAAIDDNVLRCGTDSPIFSTWDLYENSSVADLSRKIEETFDALHKERLDLDAIIRTELKTQLELMQNLITTSSTDVDTSFLQNKVNKILTRVNDPKISISDICQNDILLGLTYYSRFGTTANDYHFHDLYEHCSEATRTSLMKARDALARISSHSGGRTNYGGLPSERWIRKEDKDWGELTAQTKDLHAQFSELYPTYQLSDFNPILPIPHEIRIYDLLTAISYPDFSKDPKSDILPAIQDFIDGATAIISDPKITADASSPASILATQLSEKLKTLQATHDKCWQALPSIEREYVTRQKNSDWKALDLSLRSLYSDAGKVEQALSSLPGGAINVQRDFREWRRALRDAYRANGDPQKTTVQVLQLVNAAVEKALPKGSLPLIELGKTFHTYSGQGIDPSFLQTDFEKLQAAFQQCLKLSGGMVLSDEQKADQKLVNTVKLQSS